MPAVLLSGAADDLGSNEMGFMNETPVSRFYRDNRLFSIGGGADEVMLEIICKMGGLTPQKGKK